MRQIRINFQTAEAVNDLFVIRLVECFLAVEKNYINLVAVRLANAEQWFPAAGLVSDTVEIQIVHLMDGPQDD